MADEERYVNYLNLSSSWKRPEGPPRVWRTVDGRRVSASGETSKFLIQEVPAGLEDAVIDFMVRYFVAEEPLSVELGIGDDPLAIRELRTHWRNVLLQGVSIVALMVNSYPSPKPIIAGVDMLSILTPEDEKNLISFRSESLKKSTTVQHKLIEESNVWRKYSVDKYLRAFGLCVHPCFREQGLGEELLRTHHDIGLAYQIPLTANVLTSQASQILADHLGYEVLVERQYFELLDNEGEVAFPNMNDKFIKVMAKMLY